VIEDLAKIGEQLIPWIFLTVAVSKEEAAKRLPVSTPSRQDAAPTGISLNPLLHLSSYEK
jgi:hypothetical protein